jgi:hypothetical protein
MNFVNRLPAAGSKYKLAKSIISDGLKMHR